MFQTTDYMLNLNDYRANMLKEELKEEKQRRQVDRGGFGFRKKVDT